MGRPKLNKPNPLSTANIPPIRVDQEVVDFLNQYHRGRGDTLNRVLRRLFGLDISDEKPIKLNTKGKKRP